ncbi:MAG: YihY/virulence factor BrkB family protein [Acidimicrobiia bacterium]
MDLVRRIIAAFDRWQQRHRPTAFVVGVVKKYGDDRGSHLAALIAYYAFLSIFPLLLVFVTTLGFFLHDNAALRNDLLDTAVADFPIVGAQLKQNVHALGGNGVGLAIGLVSLVWGSLGVAQAAQHSMAQVWNIPGPARPSFLPRLARALLVLGVLGVAVVATTTLAAAAALIPESVVVSAVTIAGTAGLNVALAWLAFRVLTPKVIAGRDLWPGAIVGGIAFTGVQLLGGWLVARQLRHTSELYGFFGVVLGLLFVLYLVAQIALIAAEVNVVAARRLVPRSLAPPPLTPADEQVLADVAQAEARRPEQHVEVEFDHDRDLEAKTPEPQP